MLKLKTPFECLAHLLAVWCYFHQTTLAEAQQPFQTIIGDGYAIEVPYDWIEQPSPSYLGHQTRIFSQSGKKRGGGGGCSIQIAPILKDLTPRTGAMTGEERRALIVDSDWGLDIWKYILPNLPAARNLEIINDVPIAVSLPLIPARQLDYKADKPQGIYYYHRVIYSLTETKQIVLNCMGIGLNRSEADDSFSKNLHVFMHVQNTLRIK